MTAERAAIAAIRFGYGFHPDQAPPADAGALMAQLKGAAAASPDISGLDARARARRFVKYRKLRKRRRADPSLTPEVQAMSRQINAEFQSDVMDRIRAPIVSDRGFFERLAWFWADHFTVNGRNNLGKTLAARFEAEAIRPNISGTFRQMLRATSTHPAMIVFLDQMQSVGPESRMGRRKGRGLNENLAREIIELHTLGVGGPYSQMDVRQFAELLTGLGVNLGAGETKFQPNRAEPGLETVLGRSYGDDDPDIGDIYPALDDLADHPATARHIARKLATHFVSDAPSEALVAHVEAAFRRSGGDLPSVYQALLEHPDSWSSFGEKVKQPFDFLVSSIRAAGLKGPSLAPLLRPKGPMSTRLALLRLNQPVYQAPGPDGWPEAAEVWITAQGMAARLRWAAELGQAIAPMTDPRSFLDIAVGRIASEETRFAVTRAAEKWEGVALAIASPEFNRR